jgi:pimeloyl-ACP methyl ester carboxylesterase
MADHAADLEAALDALEETGPVVVVGMSMGGYVAFELCRRAPDRIRALVLVSTRAQADDPEGVRSRRETAARVRRSGSGVVAEGMAGKLFGPAAPEALRQRWRERMAAADPEGVIAALEGMAIRRDAFAMLATLDAPVLILVGAQDTITPAEDAERMQRAAPGSVLEVIPDAGHMAAVEQPVRVLEVLRPFLERVTAG